MWHLQSMCSFVSFAQFTSTLLHVCGTTVVIDYSACCNSDVVMLFNWFA